MTSTPEAEKAVIGALILDPSKTREVMAHVAPGDFESTVLGRLYSIITGKVAAGETIDTVTLWPAIKADPLLSRNIKNLGQVSELFDDVSTPENVAHYARIVADAGQSRRLHAAAQRFMQLADSTEIPAAEKLAMARKELEHIASEYATTTTDVPTLADILATPDAEVEWIIPNVLARRDRFVLTGEEGFGKTTLFRQMLIASASGIHPFDFTPIQPVTALVVDTENSEDQWRWETRKMASLAAKHGARHPGDAIHIHCTGRLNITSERDSGLVHSLLDQYRPDILAIGPLYKLSPRGMNSDEDAAPVIEALDRIRDRPDGPAMLMEAHAGHALGGDGRRNLRPRGSSMQLGWPEFGIGLGADGDDPTIARVPRWRGSRIRGRRIPDSLRSGGDWPWMEDGTGMNWLDLKNRTHTTDPRAAAAGKD